MIKVITYHYVRPLSTQFPHLKYLSLHTFEQQLDYFEREYGFISKTDFERILRKKKIDIPGGVLLTFDDGLSDHFHWVYPELLKRGLWGIFFVCSGHYKMKQLLGVHRVHSLLGAFDSKQIFESSLSLINDSMLDDKHIKDFDKYIYKDQENVDTFYAVKRLFNYFIKYEYRNKILDILMRNHFNEQDLFDNYYLNEEEMNIMKNHGMYFGFHSESHPVLNRLNKQKQKNEILNALNFLENCIEFNDLRLFCYPYGGPASYNDDTLDILRENNIDYAFDLDVTNNRDIYENDLIHNQYALPRYDCNRFYENV